MADTKEVQKEPEGGRNPKKPSASKPPAPSAAGGEVGVRWDRLPAGMVDVIRRTPPREYYKLRILRGSHEETMELAAMLPALDHILSVAPGLCVARMRQGELSPEELQNGFRRIRDAVSALDDAMRDIAQLAKMELREWKRERQRKRPPAGVKAG